MKKIPFVSSLLLATLLASGLAQAADAYVTDSRGAVVKSGSGLCWRTGYWTPSQATAECDPELAPRPKAAEVPAMKAATMQPAPSAPAKPTQQSLNLGADGLFQFGKAVLLPAGKTKLDGVISQLKGRSFEQIVVVGHTDRLGSAALNQQLSQKRADAVKAYLVSKKLDARLIRTEGRGSAEPVTQANQCPGKGGPKVIACLQADRRVEIRINGLK